MKDHDPVRLVPARAVRKRFGDISTMTLWRWREAGILPQPININGRNYWRETTIDAVLAEREKAASA